VAKGLNGPDRQPEDRTAGVISVLLVIALIIFLFSLPGLREFFSGLLNPLR
jgi:hypothetical protein